MKTVDEVLSWISERIQPLPKKACSLDATVGKVLAEPIYADRDQPSYDASSMDGFCIGKNDLSESYDIVGEILTGTPAPTHLEKGTAYRIYTGSQAPAGSIVIPIENCKQEKSTVRIIERSDDSNIRKTGEALNQGALAVPENTVITPAVASVLASLGVLSPHVFPAPKVFHLTTGSEIVPVEETSLSPFQIRNSNSVLVRELLASSGCDDVRHHHSKESLEDSLDALEMGRFRESDILFISGGASVGDHDHTKKVLERLGYNIYIEQVNMRPGKPLLIGLQDRYVALGIPGNPLSHFVCYHVFIKKIIQAMMGKSEHKTTKAYLRNAPVIRKNARETFWPAKCFNEDGKCITHALPWLNSGHQLALIDVNALIRIPSNTLLFENELVETIRTHE